MIRNLNIMLLLAGVFALVGVYASKFQAEGTAAIEVGLERKINQQQNELKALRADWAVLNQPNQIEPIVRRQNHTLKLAVVGADQFKSFEDLPMRPAKLNAADLTAFLEAIENGTDPIAALIEASQP